MPDPGCALAGPAPSPKAKSGAAIAPLLATLICAAAVGDAGDRGAAGDDDSARLLAQSCTGCHAPEQASTSGMPTIDGLPPAELERMLLQFKRGEREGTVMNRISRGYTEAELKALAPMFHRGALRRGLR